jgi:hydrogenase maturation protease
MSVVRTRVIGLGQRVAGDDGVGLAVLELLRARPLPDGVEVVAAADASALVDLLSGADAVIVVDAVLAARPGDVLDLDLAALASRAALPVSTHGLDVPQAIALAHVLHDEIAPSIRVLGVAVARPDHLHEGLSPAVRRGAEHAAERVRALVGA